MPGTFNRTPGLSLPAQDVAGTAASALPRHIAVIPDGNRRAASRAGLNKSDGYELGVEPGIRFVEWCLELGVSQLSVIVASQENFQTRPKRQVLALTRAFLEVYERIGKLGVGVHVFGDLDGLPDYLPERDQLLELGRSWQRQRRLEHPLVCHFAFNYSGLADIRSVAQSGRAGTPDRALTPQSDQLLSSGVPFRNQAVMSADVPVVDLVFRAGGYRRLSGLLPLQTGYAELWFTDALWPDVGREHFDRALEWFAGQQRNLGE